MKTISLQRCSCRFVIHYEVGREADVLEALVDMQKRKVLNFGWFDAAVLSHQLGRHLAQELKELSLKTPPPGNFPKI